MDILKNDDVRIQIDIYLKEKGIKKSWLANQMNITQVHLGLILKAQRDLTSKNLEKINAVLMTNFKNEAKISDQ